MGATVLDDLRRGGIRRSFNRDLQDLNRFYLDDAHRARLATMPRWRRWMALTGWLLKCLILDLSPERRLLLLLSLLFLVYGVVQSGDEHGRLAFVLYVLGYAGVLLTLMLELKDKLLARDELEVGRAVQLALLPDRNPEIAGWEIALFTRPANDVGGDLVDALWVADGRLGIALGDVSGKGLGAALLMAKLQATLRALATDGDSLGDLGRRCNAILCRDGVSGRFATLVYLELEADSGRVRLLNAGHLPPLVARTGGTDAGGSGRAAHGDGAHGQGAHGDGANVDGGGLEALAAPAPPLGVISDAVYMEQEIVLHSGDLLCIYSDGITEARDAAGGFFGDERLRRLVAGSRHATLESVRSAIVTAVDAFAGEERPSDDLSLVVVRRLE